MFALIKFGIDALTLLLLIVYGIAYIRHRRTDQSIASVLHGEFATVKTAVEKLIDTIKGKAP